MQVWMAADSVFSQSSAVLNFSYFPYWIETSFQCYAPIKTLFLAFITQSGRETKETEVSHAISRTFKNGETVLTNVVTGESTETGIVL